ncbi:hypothetical protein [Streptomyces vilmorinianum]|uniref:hypothetical protein n=1 Tax=Streptomyces vilmorinianum TaxID=3051092 RepID=UPI0020C7D4AE|nr:hypothetical protein [Streptomyces vilmorinianum]
MSAHDLPAGSLALAFAVTGGLAWLAGGRRRGAYAISGGLAAVQTVLHLIFSAGGSSHEAMDHAAMDHTAAAHSSTGMLAAHLLAALLCGLWLARGEAALFALARTVGTLAFTPLRLFLTVVRVPELPHPARPRRPHIRRLHGVVLAHTLSRRGPPRLSVPRATALGAHV